MLNEIVVLKDFLNPAVCQQLIDSLDPESVHTGKVVDKDGNELSIDGRKVNKYTNYDHNLVHQIVLTVIDNILIKYNLNIAFWAKPEILHYMGGGQYEMHCDSEVFDPENETWIPTINRDISLLLYLNDNFLGGNLEFENGFIVEPTTGVLVLFPSNHIAAHAARPVIAGDRYVMVSWLVQQGSPRPTNNYDPMLTARKGSLNW